MSAVVGRFAPSPTGVLHLGNARSFLLAWLSVRAQGGELRMRIEDLDGPRVRAGAEQECLEDLTWLGLDWDGTLVRQSEHQQPYRQALDHLLETGRAYVCTCSRKEVEQAASAPHVGEEGPIYPGTCRERYPDPQAILADQDQAAAIRFHAPPGEVRFHDGFLGPQSIDVARDLGDFVIAKRDGQAAYQLAVLIDDVAMGITEVLRGDDLLTSAARQIQLAEALDLQAPQYLHVPLVVGPDGRRLAKRHGDTSLKAFRDAGVAPEEILGWLAASCGLQETAAPLTATAMLPHYDLQALPRQQVVWTGSLKAPIAWRG